MMNPKHLFLYLLLLASGYVSSQIPALNSNPAMTGKVIYLDFDGQKVTGTSWNSGNTINALASAFTNTSIILIWQRVSEDYRPFDVNVTTDSVVFNNAPANRRTRVVITPTNAWYGTNAGGVAYIGSFNWGGTPGTPCWVFESLLGASVKNVAEACSHEAGHTFTLRHQSTYSSATCSKTAEYNPGQGSGVASWAPIMGVSYYNNVTTWYNGTSTSSCTTIQYDHGSVSPGLTSPSYLSFLPDDVGNTYASAKLLNFAATAIRDSALITTPSDVDAYKFSTCNSRYVSISVKPWALDTINYNGANLDIRFVLYNATTNSVIAIDTALNTLNTLRGTLLPPGSYYFTVDGGRSQFYSDYGSLGKYYIDIRAANVPYYVNAITTGSLLCANQYTTLNYISNGTPPSNLWTITGPTGTVTSPAPYFYTSFNAAGIYNVLLEVPGACDAIQTITVLSSPTLTLHADTLICPGATVQLTAGGASTYTWFPGNLSGPAHLVSPAVTTSYSVSGTTGQCSNSVVTTVSVNPDFILNVTATGTLLCLPQSATLSASGAGSYTFNPGGITTASLAVSPPVSTTYIITGKSATCSKTVTKHIDVSPAFTLHVSSTDTVLCEEKFISLTSSGAANYTVNPGNISTNPAVIYITQPQTYTVTATNTDNCRRVATINIILAECTGITEHSGIGRLSIYPNPAQDELKISSDIAFKKIEIVNALGETVYEKENSGEHSVTIVTLALSNGIYILKASFSDKKMVVKKFIVQH